MKTPTTSKRLTAELNKILPNTSLFNCSAHEASNEDLAAFISSSGVTVKHFEKIKGEITKKLAASPYVNDFMIIHKEKLNGTPDFERGFYVYAYDNDEQKLNAIKAKLTLEMESLLDIQKLVLAKKTTMLVTVKEWKTLKDELVA